LKYLIVVITYIILLYNFYFILLIKEKTWGLGIGDWGLGPIPNPQSPIPKEFWIITYFNNFNK